MPNLVQLVLNTTQEVKNCNYFHVVYISRAKIKVVIFAIGIVD